MSNEAANRSPFDDAVARIRDGGDVRTEAGVLYDQLTDDERLGLLDGDIPFWPGMAEILFEGYNLRPYPMGAVPRMGVPGLLFVDGPRGCVVGRSTAFPVSMARGATWDTELEERVGAAIGTEIQVQGGTFFGGVCINLPRHPAWGRSQETYGEDPVLLGRMGSALVRGTRPHAMPCVKHYALNSMENARFVVDVQVDEATLHECYLPHFREAVQAGTAAVMSAYNSVNGQWAGQNVELLTTILRDDWGFDGTVITDFIWGMRDGTAALRAGLDVEAPFAQQRAARLAADLATGRADWADVRRAGLRTLGSQLRHHADRPELDVDASVVAGHAHRALAREVAARSMVLLRNEPVDGVPVLPLDAGSLRSVAVLGRLADLPNTGDHGSSDVRPPDVVTPLAGLRAALPGVEVLHVVGSDPAEAASQAADADVAVLVVGYTAREEGEYVGADTFGRPELRALYPEPSDEQERAIAERLTASVDDGLSMAGNDTAGGDRASLHLLDEDVTLIRAVAAANPRTVVAVVAAGAVLMSEWDTEVPAVLMAWYAGMEGGNGLADVLLGDVDTGGRLPFAIPADDDHLPAFDRDATSVVYDRWFGQRLLERLGVSAAYPLGFGLSYSAVTTTVREVARNGDRVRVAAAVRCTGPRDARHVVQVYGTSGGQRLLVGFAAVAVPAGAEVDVVVDADLTALGAWDPDRRQVVAPTGPVQLEISGHWGDPDAVVTRV